MPSPNITNIPSNREPLVGSDGKISVTWYRFFLNLFTLLGGGQTDLTVLDLAIQPFAPDPGQAISDSVSQAQLASLLAGQDMSAASLAQTVQTQPLPSDTAALQQAISDLQTQPAPVDFGALTRLANDLQLAPVYGGAAAVLQPRTFSYTGDVTGGPTIFDGTKNVTTAMTLAATIGGPHTWTGNVNITPASGTTAFLGMTSSGAADAGVIMDSPTGQNRFFLFRAAGLSRFSLQCDGSGNFSISRYDGSGNFLATGLYMQWSDGYGQWGGRLDILGVLLTQAVTVATLSSPSGAAGARSFVTDATVAVFGTIVVGGGTNGVPVFSDGTNWRIG